MLPPFEVYDGQTLHRGTSSVESGWELCKINLIHEAISPSMLNFL